VEGLGGFIVGDDDDARGVRSAYEEGKIKGAGGEGEARDTSAPRASAQMTAYTLEGFRMLHVSEELADEGKNHAELILVDVPFSASKQPEYYLLPRRKASCVAARCGVTMRLRTEEPG